MTRVVRFFGQDNQPSPPCSGIDDVFARLFTHWNRRQSDTTNSGGGCIHGLLHDRSATSGARQKWTVELQ